MAEDRLYVDTNIFIYAFENNDVRAKQLLQIIGLNEGRRQPFLATSEIAFAELLVGPLRQENQRLIELYENLTIGNAYVLVGTISREVLWNAAHLRAKHSSLRLPDAIHLSTAMLFGCRQFLSGDTKLASTYEISPSRLIPHQKASEIAVIQPETSVLETILKEFTS